MPVVLNINIGSGTAIVEQPEDSSGIISTSASHAGPEETPHQAKLYADETVYTLRFPVGSNVATLDLGNTARPVLLRKRGRIPSWDAQQDSGVNWGREFGSAWR